jgi:TonB family protein
MNSKRIIGAALFVAMFAGTVESLRADAGQRLSAKAHRIACIGFIGAPAGPYDAAIRAALLKDERAVLIDPSQMQPALKGIGYRGSINLSLEEAQGIGAAIGCDFFIIGKAESSRRSESADEAHEESFIAVMIVDSRSGQLAVFDFILEKAATTEAAQSRAAQTLASRLPGYLEKLYEFRAARESIIPLSNEVVEDLPDEKSARAAGFKAPEFINRVKPDYSEEAARADITATVEANVVFRANGETGAVEIVRWAGFGLDEAAIRAVRQLKFKPASRDNQALHVRALIRYNFRRVSESEAQQKPRAPEPKQEKPQPDLRQLFKPRFRIPPKPNDGG